MPRRPELRLIDIIERCDTVTARCEGVSLDDFVADDVLHDSVIYPLIVIGEAAGNLPPESLDAMTGIEWAKVRGFRNFVVHQYFATHLEIAWAAATRDVPRVRATVWHYLEAEYPDAARIYAERPR